MAFQRVIALPVAVQNNKCKPRFKDGIAGRYFCLNKRNTPQSRQVNLADKNAATTGNSEPLLKPTTAGPLLNQQRFNLN